MLEKKDGGRADWIGVLAQSFPVDLRRVASAFVENLSWEWLRQPEAGLVMVRGRAGGTGNPFNLGEMTVTRCALRLADGIVGYGYVQGRDEQHAKLAALVDALLQRDGARDVLIADIIEPLRGIQTERRNERSAKAASTKVEFFIMVRGANPV